MKSSILTASYLWKDIWSGWFERPGSFLSKALVTVILGSLATVLLIAFFLQERDLRHRMERFGLNSIVITETLTSHHPRHLQPVATDPLLTPLKTTGSLQVIQHLLLSIAGPERERWSVWILPENDFLHLLPWPLPKLTAPALLLSSRYPEGAYVPVVIDGIEITARTLHEIPHLQTLPDGDKLILPEGILPRKTNRIYQEYHIYRMKDSHSLLTQSRMEQLGRLYQTEQRQQVSLQSSHALQEQLEELQQIQTLWKTFLALLLGAVLALILGSLSFLEYQQNQYVNALLRSFGATSVSIFSRFLLEALLIINTSLILSILLIRSLHPLVFGSLQFPPSVLYTDISSAYISPEVFVLFLWANAGGLLSILPIGWMLRKPIGYVLS